MQDHHQHIHGRAAATADGTWSTGFCDCFSDCSSCCLTFWCPCVTFGRIAEIVDRGSTSCGTAGGIYTLIMVFTSCACVYSAFYKTKMRELYNLKGNACSDFCAHFCCELCALTQEYRELRNRGFDMSLGWHGNLEKQNAGVAMGAPVVEGGMKR